LTSETRAPAHPGPGLEAHEAVGLGAGRVDDLPDIDAHALGEDRELVHERDVDRAEDVLEQLCHLGRLGRGDALDVLANAPVELGRTVGAGLGDAADHLRRVVQRVVGPARVDALGGERDVDVRTDLQRRVALNRRHQQLARGARVGGRLEHHQLPLLHHM
jgi:hypothetical protein